MQLAASLTSCFRAEEEVSGPQLHVRVHLCLGMRSQVGILIFFPSSFMLLQLETERKITNLEGIGYMLQTKGVL